MRFHHYFIILLLLCVHLSCKQKLSAEQGEKHLRAFDNELISFSKQISGSETYKVFEKLFSIQNLPIPLRYHEQEKGTPYPFNELKGIYRYDSLTNKCIKSTASDSIIIYVPLRSSKIPEAKFIVAHYTEEPSIWGIMFPTQIDMKLELDGRAVASIISSGKLKYQVPTASNTTIQFDQFSFNMDLRSKLSRKKSKMFVNAQLNNAQRNLLSCNSEMEVAQTDIAGTLFHNTQLELKVFPLCIYINSQYEAIDPATHNFIASFNKNVNIKIETNEQAQLGKILLKEIPTSNRLNFAVEYSDGTSVLLEDFLFFARWVMHVKC